MAEGIWKVTSLVLSKVMAYCINSLLGARRLGLGLGLGLVLGAFLCSPLSNTYNL